MNEYIKMKMIQIDVYKIIYHQYNQQIDIALKANRKNFINIFLIKLRILT